MCIVFDYLKRRWRDRERERGKEEGREKIIFVMYM